MSSTFIKAVILISIATTVIFSSGCDSSGAGKVHAQRDRGARRISVATVTVEARTFEERIRAQGNLSAKMYTLLSPCTGGVITDLFVEEGDVVKADETPLFQTDKVVMTQAYEIAVQDRNVAACASRDMAAQLVAARAMHDKAKLDYERFTRLREQQAVTLDVMEQMEAGYAVAKAQLDRADTGVTLRAEQEKQAEAALVIAKKQLDDSLVVSPLSGRVSYCAKEQGEYVSKGTTIVKVIDPSVLEVSAFLPGEYYARIKPGETQIRVRVNGIDLGVMIVRYKSPEIQEKLRTFEIKCCIESPPEGVVPGAIANIEVVLQTRGGLGVPYSAVQLRDDKTVVFVVKDGTAESIEIRKGLSGEGYIEVLDSVLEAGAPVITLGSNLVDDGTLVDVQRGER